VLINALKQPGIYENSIAAIIEPERFEPERFPTAPLANSDASMREQVGRKYANPGANALLSTN
jgi:hypothetical protein